MYKIKIKNSTYGSLYFFKHVEYSTYLSFLFAYRGYNFKKVYVIQVVHFSVSKNYYKLKNEYI